MESQSNNAVAKLIDLISIRLTSPFLMSFFLSFPFWNWRLILVLFSNHDYSIKFWYVDNILWFGNNYSVSIFFGPLTTAFFYTFIWPILDGWFVVVRQHIDNRMKKHVLRANQKIPVDVNTQDEFFEEWNKKLEESFEANNKIHKKYVESKKRYIATIQEFRGRISQAKWNELSRLSGNISISSLHHLIKPDGEILYDHFAGTFRNYYFLTDLIEFIAEIEMLGLNENLQNRDVPDGVLNILMPDGMVDILDWAFAFWLVDQPNNPENLFKLPMNFDSQAARIKKMYQISLLPV